MAKSSKKVDVLTHKKARRINVPTAELQSLAEQQEEVDPRPLVNYSRARPLPKGETRKRDADLDPQIVWNGIKITLTKEQAEQLAQTGTVEIGDAQLVWRGKDRAGLVQPRGQRADALCPGESAAQGDHR
jgi:adenine-specific DNA-methyltransferase